MFLTALLSAAAGSGGAPEKLATRSDSVQYSSASACTQYFVVEQSPHGHDKFLLCHQAYAPLSFRFHGDCSDVRCF
jgi:hypothetical protein